MGEGHPHGASSHPFPALPRECAVLGRSRPTLNLLHLEVSPGLGTCWCRTAGVWQGYTEIPIADSAPIHPLCPSPWDGHRTRSACDAIKTEALVGSIRSSEAGGPLRDPTYLGKRAEPFFPYRSQGWDSRQGHLPAQPEGCPPAASPSSAAAGWHPGQMAAGQGPAARSPDREPDHSDPGREQ